MAVMEADTAGGPFDNNRSKWVCKGDFYMKKKVRRARWAGSLKAKGRVIGWGGE